MIRDQLPRTECSCEGCQVGCRTMPAMCGIGDIERIVDYCEAQWRKLWGNNHFNRSQWFATHFVASDGAKVGRLRSDGSVEVLVIPTITPAQQKNGHCVFYKDGRCSIHPVAPIGCSHCDIHMSKTDGDAVVRPILGEIMDDERAGGLYAAQHLSLVNAGRTARPLAERRAAFEREFAKVRADVPRRNPPESLDA